MTEINKCHVCGSERIVKDVKNRSGDSSLNSCFLWWYETIKSTSFFSRKENYKKDVHFAPVRTSVCRDCGTVRFYVNNGDREWKIEK